MSDQQPDSPTTLPDRSPQAPLSTSQERTSAMLTHLLALAGYIIPLGNIIGPLVIWLMQKDKSAFVDQQGKESLNFQITVTIASLLCIPLIFVCVGIPLLIAVAVASLVFIIIAAINANAGTAYRYPFTWRVIK